MQIRLSVCGPHEGGPPFPTHGRERAAAAASAQAVDVLVTAPAGTQLGAVAGALAGAVGARQGARTGRAATQVQLFVGDQRLDERAVLGHPPLVDGALLRLDEPDPDHVPIPLTDSPAELRVVGGPDAGGIHLLRAGLVRVGRSSGADVPVDDLSLIHI